jgi:sterol desaturase/sphingolipid hydroxylase (fatty acid hydroxylase superfamily)
MTLLPEVVDLFSVLVFSVLLIGVGRAIEWLRPAQPDQPSESVRFNLKYALVNVGASWLFAPFAGAVAVFLVNRAGGGFIQLRSDGWWFPVSLSVYLVMKDLLEYFWHRSQHSIPVLWAMHSLHHSDEAFNVSTGWRHFWFEGVLRIAVVFPILGIIFETPVAILNTAAILYTLNHAWAHLNIRLSLGRWKLWVMNPQYHRLHHSVEPEHWNRNFADLFPVIDVIFGTASVPRSDEFPATGLVPHERPKSVFDAVIWPLNRSRSPQSSAGIVSSNSERHPADSLTKP